MSSPTWRDVPGFAKRVCFGIMHKDVTVAITRLETMLGDSAVAAHPDDARYTHLPGKRVRHPFAPQRAVPIVCDAELVDMAFGTGCVNITPAHDHNDFECGKRHGLKLINVLNEDGTINGAGGACFAGKKRYDVHKQLVAALREKLRKVLKQAFKKKYVKHLEGGSVAWKRVHVLCADALCIYYGVDSCTGCTMSDIK